MTQLTLAKESIKVIVNELNEAIVLRTEQGNFGFCNFLGLQILLPLAQKTYPEDVSFLQFLRKLNSFDYLLKNSSK